MKYPLLLEAPLKDYLWGGTRLKEEYGKNTDLDKVAESWELSCHEAGLSVIASGPDKGKTLKEWLEEQGDAVLGKRAAAFDYFPLLIKLIDAKGDLSVQVHPDNEYALRVEGEYGKTEMWYIVDCEPGASLLYGFKIKTVMLKETLVFACPNGKGQIGRHLFKRYPLMLEFHILPIPHLLSHTYEHKRRVRNRHPFEYQYGENRQAEEYHHCPLEYMKKTMHKKNS